MSILFNFVSDLKIFLKNRFYLEKIKKKFRTCKLHNGAFIDSESLLGKMVVLFPGASITASSINDHTFVQKNSTINHSEIGKFCSIAAGVTIGLGQHPISQVSSHPAFYSKNQPIIKTFSSEDTFQPFKKTTIGNDVWIGQNASIMDGVKIGNGAIIAAGSVVTSEVAPYAIVGGVPAKLIRFRFEDTTIAELNKIEWWNLSEEKLAEIQCSFREPQKFLRLFGDVDKK